MSLELLNNPFTENFKDWENENNLSEFDKITNYNENNLSFEKISAFKNSPFGQYWEKRIPKYAEQIYGSGSALGPDAFRIFDLSKKFSNSQADFYSLLISEDWKDIDFKVFAHPNGDEVLKQYASFTPLENEVIFCIETNDGKIDFGKIVRVKLGKNAIEKLHFRFPFIGETSEEDLADALLKRPFQIKEGKEFQFFNTAKIEVENAQKDTEELKNLLVKAINYEYNQKKFDDISWFMIFLQGDEWIGLNTPKKLMEISQWFRSKKYEEEKYWNAHLKKEFTPAFLPQFLVKDDNHKREKAIKELVKSKINLLTKEEQDDAITTKIYKQILRSILLYLFDCYYQTIKIVGIALTETSVLYNLNAFLVGLWNGCLEFVAGMIDLVALSIVIARDGIGYTMTDALAEKFENLLNEIVDNFEAFIKNLWDKFIYAINDFPDWFIQYGTNPYYWYKNIGELVPDILTFLVPALKAGRAAKLAEAGKIGATAAKEATEEVSEEIMQKSAKELSEKLEQKTAQQEVKESFDKAENELEEKIPETKEIEEVAFWMSKELQILLKNENFRKIYKELANGTVKRAFRETLLLEEEAVLRFYTTNAGYKNFNKALRGEMQMTEFYKTQEKLMNQALDKLPSYKSESLLYRIENLTDAEINKIYREGEEVTNKHFTSTTYSEEAIERAIESRPANLLIRIESKSGKLIENLSTLKKEKEILFKSNTKFHVKEIGFEPNPYEPWRPIKRIILIEK